MKHTGPVVGLIGVFINAAEILFLSFCSIPTLVNNKNYSKICNDCILAKIQVRIIAIFIKDFTPMKKKLRDRMISNL